MKRHFSAQKHTISNGMWDEPYSVEYDEEEDPYNCFTDDDTIERKAGSAMDCTGLIPSLPQSDAELESYSEMYRYPGEIDND